MRNWSVNLALNVGILLLVVLVVLTVSVMLSLMSLNFLLGWPMYVTVPIVFIGLITAMVTGFYFLGKLWVPWIYLNVIDVVEFEKAAGLSGFLAYPVESIKDEYKRSLIEARFKEYQFTDDYEVPFETVIYFRKPYQNMLFLLMVAFFIFSLIHFIKSPEFGPIIVVPLTFLFIIYVLFRMYSDRSPQFILSENGIEANGVFYKWDQITSYFILLGKKSYLTIDHNEGNVEYELDNLTIGNQKINHLLHIYYYRHKMKISTQM